MTAAAAGEVSDRLSGVPEQRPGAGRPLLVGLGPFIATLRGTRSGAVTFGDTNRSVRDSS